MLAKNRPPTREDEDATARLIAIITDPATRNAHDVFPFLLSHCRANMDKRISNLHESISAFLPDFHSVLPLYRPLSVEKKSSLIPLFTDDHPKAKSQNSRQLSATSSSICLKYPLPH